MNKKSIFKYIVIFGVLLIPFIYSFFYLKAYWDPYGEGNIDNLPVALINNDKGNNGKKIIESIKDSKKLKIEVVSSENAKEGLDDGDYYAIIEIPSDFTENLESVKTDNKKHSVITYMPNQKTNYLSSQIINTVMNVVEKNLDNQVNVEIVKELEDNMMDIEIANPSKNYAESRLESSNDDSQFKQYIALLSKTLLLIYILYNTNKVIFEYRLFLLIPFFIDNKCKL